MKTSTSIFVHNCALTSCTPTFNASKEQATLKLKKLICDQCMVYRRCSLEMVELFVYFFVKCYSQNSFDQIRVRTTSLPETGCKFTSKSRIIGYYDNLAVRVFQFVKQAVTRLVVHSCTNRCNGLDLSQKRSTFFMIVDMLYVVHILSLKL